MVDLRNSNFEPNPKLVKSRKHCWLALFGREYLTDNDTGNSLQPPMHTHTHTHTNTPTMWLGPMNIKYSGVSKFLGFHLSIFYYFVPKYFIPNLYLSFFSNRCSADHLSP
jgi:hypothetical protein